MKKKNLLIIFVFLFPLCLIIGYSTWVIVYNVFIQPAYINNEVASYFAVEQNVPYNGYEQVPVSNPINKYSDDLITYEYKTFESISSYVVGKPKEIGVYDVKITVKDVGVTKVKFTIRKNQLSFKRNILELDYNNSNWQNLQTNIKSQIICVDELNNTFDNNPVTISGITNGSVVYNSSFNNSIVIGSTYLVEYELAAALSGNYLAPTEKLLFKYKSALIGNNKYTIEDAILSQTVGNTITISFLGSNSGYTTSFCNLTLDQGYPYDVEFGSGDYKDKRIFKIMNGNTLYVPYNDGIVKEGNERTQSEFINTGIHPVYSALIIPETVALVFESTSYLTISSVIGSLGSVGAHGVLVNNGIISVESKCELKSFGFLKGTGEVILRSGSIAYDLMRMYDWPGGRNASGMISSAFPVVSWSFHNISCPMKIMNGAELRGYSLLYMSGLLGGTDEYFTPFTIVGATPTTGGCLFVPNTSDSSHYIYKYSKSSETSNLINESITDYNQTIGYFDCIEIHGNYKDVVFELSVSGYTFKTSSKKCMPLSYINVIIKDDPEILGESKLTLSKSSYIFLSGTYLEVEPNTILELGSDIYVAFDSLVYNQESQSYTASISDYFVNGAPIYGSYSGKTGIFCVNKQSAFLKLNGELNGSGFIGGKIISSTIGATLNISNFVIADIHMKKTDAADGSVCTNYNAYGNILNGSSFIEKNFHLEGSAVTYTSSSNNDIDYFFIPNTDLKVFNFELYDETGQMIDSKKVYAVGNGEEGENKKYIYTLKGTEFSPYKKHFTLINWGIKDNNGNFIPINQESLDPDNPIIFIFDEEQAENNIIKFYANFNLITYTISYTAGITSSSTGLVPFDGEYLTGEYVTSFTINDFISNDGTSTYINLPIPIIQFTETSYWYVGNVLLHSDFTITYLSKEYIDEYVDVYNSTEIKLYCEYNQNTTYTLVFKDVLSDESFTSISVVDGDIVKLPNSKWNTNPYQPKYLEGFYLITSVNPSDYIDKNKFDNTQFYDDGMLFDESRLSKYVVSGTNNEIYIYCHFIDKECVITYKNRDSDEIFSTQYCIKGKSITLEDNTNSSNELINLSDGSFEDSSSFYNIKYKFIGWVSSSDSAVSYVSGENNVKFNSNETLIADYSEEFYNKISASADGINSSTQVFVYLYENDTIIGSKQLTSGSSIEYSPGSKVKIEIKFNASSEERPGNCSYTISYVNLGLDEIKSGDIKVTSSVQTKSVDNLIVCDDLRISTTWDAGSCIPSGSLITLADGSEKKVEDLTLDDLLLVFNHETGMFEASPIVFIDCDQWTEYNIVNLVFSDGTITRLIYEHGYFDVTLNKYVYVDEYNYRDFIGHQFVYTNGEKLENVTLVDSYITTEYVGCYSPVTAVHLNYIVDGMLSMPGGIEGIFNIFEYGDNLMFDEELMKADIEKYGIMEYEVLAPYVPYEMYIAFNAKYFNVAIGKGYITFDEILYYAEKYLDKHGLRE